MGNSKARAVYEANVPEGFRRLQTDSQLDVFIRAKYEKKKYIAREWVPTKAPELPEGWTALIEAEKQKKDIRSIVLPSHTKDSKEEIVKRFKNMLIYFVFSLFRNKRFMLDEMTRPAKRFKICHISYLQKHKVAFSVFHFVLLYFFPL